MTIESLIRYRQMLARLTAKQAQAVVDFEDASLPIAAVAQDAQQAQADDVAAHEMQFDDAAIPAGVSAQDSVTLPEDFKLPVAVKRRKGKGSK